MILLYYILLGYSNSMDQSKHRAISSTEEEYFTVFKEIMRTWVKQVQRQREVTHKLPEFEPKFDWLFEHVITSVEIESTVPQNQSQPT